MADNDDLNSLVYYAPDGGKLEVDAEYEWSTLFPNISPQQAYAILTKELPPANIIIFPNIENPECISIYINGCKNNFSDKRDFNIKSGLVESGYMSVRSNGGHKKIGCLLMRNEIDFFYLAGFIKLNIRPSSTVGGYAWAKFGFLPTELLLDNLVRDLQTRFKFAIPFLTLGQARDLSRLIQLRNPTDIWHIADRPEIVNDWVNAVEAPSSQPCIRKLKIMLNNAWNNSAIQDDALRRKIVISDSQHPITLGKFLLLRSSWYGEFDFSNAQQAKRSAEYAGGYQYIPH